MDALDAFWSETEASPTGTAFSWSAIPTGAQREDQPTARASLCRKVGVAFPPGSGRPAASEAAFRTLR